MKRLISMLLVITMICSIMPLGVFADEISEERYNVLNEKEYIFLDINPNIDAFASAEVIRDYAVFDTATDSSSEFNALHEENGYSYRTRIPSYTHSGVPIDGTESYYYKGIGNFNTDALRVYPGPIIYATESFKLSAEEIKIYELNRYTNVTKATTTKMIAENPDQYISSTYRFPNSDNGSDFMPEIEGIEYVGDNYNVILKNSDTSVKFKIGPINDKEFVKNAVDYIKSSNHTITVPEGIKGDKLTVALTSGDINNGGKVSAFGFDPKAALLPVEINYKNGERQLNYAVVNYCNLVTNNDLVAKTIVYGDKYNADGTEIDYAAKNTEDISKLKFYTNSGITLDDVTFPSNVSSGEINFGFALRARQDDVTSDYVNKLNVGTFKLKDEEITSLRLLNDAIPGDNPIDGIIGFDRDGGSVNNVRALIPVTVKNGEEDKVYFLYIGRVIQQPAFFGATVIGASLQEKIDALNEVLSALNSEALTEEDVAYYRAQIEALKAESEYITDADFDTSKLEEAEERIENENNSEGEEFNERYTTVDTLNLPHDVFARDADFASTGWSGVTSTVEEPNVLAYKGFQQNSVSTKYPYERNDTAFRADTLDEVVGIENDGGTYTYTLGGVPFKLGTIADEGGVGNNAYVIRARFDSTAIAEPFTVKPLSTSAPAIYQASAAAILNATYTINKSGVSEINFLMTDVYFSSNSNKLVSMYVKYEGESEEVPYYTIIGSGSDAFAKNVYTIKKSDYDAIKANDHLETMKTRIELTLEEYKELVRKYVGDAEADAVTKIPSNWTTTDTVGNSVWKALTAETKYQDVMNLNPATLDTLVENVDESKLASLYQEKTTAVPSASGKFAKARRQSVGAANAVIYTSNVSKITLPVDSTKTIESIRISSDLVRPDKVALGSGGFNKIDTYNIDNSLLMLSYDGSDTITVDGEEYVMFVKVSRQCIDTILLGATLTNTNTDTIFDAVNELNEMLRAIDVETITKEECEALRLKIEYLKSESSFITDADFDTSKLEEAEERFNEVTSGATYYYPIEYNRDAWFTFAEALEFGAFDGSGNPWPTKDLAGNPLDTEAPWFGTKGFVRLLGTVQKSATGFLIDSIKGVEEKVTAQGYKSSTDDTIREFSKKLVINGNPNFELESVDENGAENYIYNANGFKYKLGPIGGSAHRTADGGYNVRALGENETLKFERVQEGAQKFGMLLASKQNNEGTSYAALEKVVITYSDGSKETKYLVVTNMNQDAASDAATSYDGDRLGRLVVAVPKDVDHTTGSVLKANAQIVSEKTSEELIGKAITVDDVVFPSDFIVGESVAIADAAIGRNSAVTQGKRYCPGGYANHYEIDFGSDVESIEYQGDISYAKSYPGAVRNGQVAYIPVEIPGASEDYLYYARFGRPCGNYIYLMAASSKALSDEEKIAYVNERLTVAETEEEIVAALEEMKNLIDASEVGLSAEDFDAEGAINKLLVILYTEISEATSIEELNDINAKIDVYVETCGVNAIEIKATLEDKLAELRRLEELTMLSIDWNYKDNSQYLINAFEMSSVVSIERTTSYYEAIKNQSYINTKSAIEHIAIEEALAKEDVEADGDGIKNYTTTGIGYSFYPTDKIQEKTGTFPAADGKYYITAPSGAKFEIKGVTNTVGGNSANAGYVTFNTMDEDLSSIYKIELDGETRYSDVKVLVAGVQEPIWEGSPRYASVAQANVYYADGSTEKQLIVIPSVWGYVPALAGKLKTQEQISGINQTHSYVNATTSLICLCRKDKFNWVPSNVNAEVFDIGSYMTTTFTNTTEERHTFKELTNHSGALASVSVDTKGKAVDYIEIAPAEDEVLEEAGAFVASKNADPHNYWLPIANEEIIELVGGDNANVLTSNADAKVSDCDFYLKLQRYAANSSRGALAVLFSASAKIASPEDVLEKISDKFAKLPSPDEITEENVEEVIEALDEFLKYIEDCGYAVSDLDEDMLAEIDAIKAKIEEINQFIASGECGENLTWTLDEDGLLTISGEGEMENYSDYSSVPWYDYATDITEVIIEDGVTTIGDWAFFECYSLTSIEIPDSVTTIGNSAFYNCYSLTSINVDENNDNYCSIDGNLFDKNKTTIIQYAIGKTNSSYTIPDNVTTIGNDAFSLCSSLTSVEIPDSVTTIGETAFFWCSSLTNIEIPDSVTTIGESAFAECSNLTSVVIGNSVTTIGSHVFEYCSRLTSVKIPDSVTAIGYFAFGDCSNLTSVEIGDSVTSIGDYAFYRCSSLTSVEIPDSVTTIGEAAFVYCDNLTDVYYNGTEEEWANISIGTENEPLLNATFHFAEPTETIPGLTATAVAGLVYTGDVIAPERAIVIEGLYAIDVVTYNSVEIKNAGTYTVTATVVREGYLPTTVSTDVTVAKKPVTLTVNDATKYVGEADPVFTAVVEGLVGEDVLDYTLTREEGENAGEYEITAILGENPNYEVVVVNGVLTIESRPIETDALIKLSKVRGVTGHRIEVDVEISGNPGIASMMLKVDYDKNNLKLVDVIDGGKLGNTLHSNNFEGMPYVLSWENDTASENITENGIVATLVFEAVEDAVLGFYPITVSYDNDNHDIFDVNLETVYFGVENGEIELSDFFYGDVNGDHAVNTMDRLILTRYLAKWTGFETIDVRAADVNNDGHVNTLDRAILARHLANWTGYEFLPYRN